jgi:hypothetical protein
VEAVSIDNYFKANRKEESMVARESTSKRKRLGCVGWVGLILDRRSQCVEVEETAGRVIW